MFDDQMIDASKDKRIVNLFTRGSHHRNLSVIYIVQNLFHQGKGSRSISLNRHYLVLFMNPRDKLQILTLAKQMYPGKTDFFLNQYEEAVKGPFGYLLIDVKTTTQDNCRLRTNVLPSEEGFNQAGFQENIPQEFLKYLKQQIKLFRLSHFFQLCKKFRATWMTCFLETIFGTMRKLSDPFSCKTDT